MTTIAVVIIGRAITLERAIKKRSKELIPKNQTRLKVITLQGAIEKSKNENFDIHSTKNYFAFFGERGPIIYLLTVQT